MCAKMDLIVDVQFCKDARNRNISKEVGVISLKENFLAHWIIAPPHSIGKLSTDIRQQNSWLHKNCHGIVWADGDVSQTRVKKNLQEILKNAEKIYVRGREKAVFLQELTANEIVNLEVDDDCPPFAKLTWVNTYCFYHATKSGYLSLNCALNNAAKLKFWLEKSKNEQFRDFADSFASTISHSGCISERYDPSDLAEASSVCF